MTKTTTKSPLALNKAFIDAIYTPCQRIWYECGQEVAAMAEEAGEYMTDEVAWEVILDAGRLNQIDPVAGKLVDAACDRFGYENVLKFLGRNVRWC
jgi:hypothetical protein